MDDSAESKDDADKEILGNSNSSLDLKKVKPPNKKKHEDEVESLQNIIKEKETLLRSLTAENFQNFLKATRAEKLAVIEKLKKIDTDLKAFSQQITKKKGIQDQLQSRLHYRSDVKIDDAIRRLEWQLKIQNFKMTEEKKIVAEIDSLKRSKKDLSQFLAAKKEVDEIRERQRRMREERDRYQKNVNQLRNKEDETKKLLEEKKSKLYVLKKEIDKLYTRKRHMIHEFKQHEKEYNEVKDEMKKQKKRDSFKRKEESKSHMEAFQNDIEEYGLQKEPYEDEIKLCNTLINYLQKFQVAEDEVEEPSKNTGVVDELDDGKYILLKKTEDTDYSSVRPTRRRSSKKGKKFSVTKPITHAPQIFSQFASLMLNAPSTIPEIIVSLEQVQARKTFYEEGGPIPTQRMVTPSIEEHSASETGISATESAMCEMSRQVSNTESNDNPEDSFFVLDELVKLSGNDDNLSDKSEDTLARSNSDSTDRGHSDVDNSELSPESRKGSDVSECESTVISSESLKNQLANSSNLKTSSNSVPKTSSELLQISTGSSIDSCSNEDQTQNIPKIDAWTIPRSVLMTEPESQNSKSGTIQNLSKTDSVQFVKKDVAKSGNTKLPLFHDAEFPTLKKDMYKKPNVINNEFEHLTEFDQNALREIDSNTFDQTPKNNNTCCKTNSVIDDDSVRQTDFIGNRKYKDTICRQDDSFVVIDDNSNIHDLAEGSNGDHKNICDDYCNTQDRNIIFSTHL
ncbi:DNA ligase 1-like [Mytilus trossulus]|uniref:DNA ligase 1-like n=1 Tax=Mytilus trossulus TaxID=6551 RepID=UPI003003DA87